ncbi:GNAT superfamily N-acetyltransferase [Pseudomonas frederiksbergensis]
MSASELPGAAKKELQSTMEIVYLCDHPELINELAELNFKEWGHFRADDTVEGRIEHLQANAGKGSVPTVMVAIEGSQLLGGAMLLTRDMAARAELTPWLAGVYVKEEHRGRGIASQLVARIVQEAATLGVPELYLYTDTSQTLYARQGWEVLEQRVYQGLDVTVMKRGTAAP